MDAIIDMGHPLVKLAQAIDWTFLKREFGAVYTDCPGQPPLPTRLMAGLAMVPGLRQANFNEALIRIKASGRALYTKLLVRDETTQIPTRHRVGGRMTQVERVAGFQKATATTPAKTTGQGILRVAALIVLAGFVTAALIFWLLSQKETADRLLVLYGNIDIREIAVAFNNNGPVTRMLVQEGDRVRRGELIAEMDDRRYVAALEQAEGQMRNQEQVLARLVAGSRPEEIAQAKATMDALSVTYQNDEVIYRRAETLLRTGAGTTKERDDTKAAFEAARHQYEAARQAYILAEKGSRAEDIAAQRAAYEAALGTVALDKRELADTKLYAPADGIVEDRILEPGDMASPSTAVYTIALTNPLWVRVYVPETALGKVALGMRATIGTDSFPGRTYRGWVGYLAPTAEFTPKNVETPELRTRLVYQLRVYVCDPGSDLRLGMPATVQIDLSQPPPEQKQDAALECGAGNGAGK